MSVEVRIPPHTLRLSEVIGSGGEAMLYRWRADAVKIYRVPDTTPTLKLNALIAAAPRLPSGVITPHALAFEPRSGRPVGFAMPLVDSSYAPLRVLPRRGLPPHAVLALFTDLHSTLCALHDCGVVVGDLNDRNVLFHGRRALLIDVDSVQFAGYPCRVASEPFVDPRLYGIDLARQPVFTPADDWYSFSVLLFRALTGVHPYSGVHRALPTLAQRAQARVSVFDPAVLLPQGTVLDALQDDLRVYFVDVFAHGQRGLFPSALLTALSAPLPR